VDKSFWVLENIQLITENIPAFMENSQDITENIQAFMDNIQSKINYILIPVCKIVWRCC